MSFRVNRMANSIVITGLIVVKRNIKPLKSLKDWKNMTFCVQSSQQ